MGVQCLMVEKLVERVEMPCTCGNDGCTNRWQVPVWRRVSDGTLMVGYSSPFGPGSMWWEEPPVYEVDGQLKPYYWDNDSKHLLVLGPTGQEWDIDSRASNCGQKDERTHRCWIRHGEPPNITVDKNGKTCGAGGGSIWFDMPQGWHGFLRNGQFV